MSWATRVGDWSAGTGIPVTPHITDYLTKTGNLADVPSPSLALGNLGGIQDSTARALIALNEPNLGNPLNAGQLLASDLVGNRVWVDPPVASVAGLLPAKNLADVLDVVVALANLGGEASLGNPAIAGQVLVSDVAGVRSWVTLPTSNTGSEPSLGNPTATGMMLTSSLAGVRSWVAAPSAAAGALLAANNLSDIPNPALARFNLGVVAPPVGLLPANNLSDVLNPTLALSNLGGNKYLGLPSLNGYILSGNTDGTYVWVDPLNTPLVFLSPTPLLRYDFPGNITNTGSLITPFASTNSIVGIDHLPISLSGNLSVIDTAFNSFVGDFSYVVQFSISAFPSSANFSCVSVPMGARNIYLYFGTAGAWRVYDTLASGIITSGSVLALNTLYTFMVSSKAGLLSILIDDGTGYKLEVQGNLIVPVHSASPTIMVANWVGKLYSFKLYDIALY